MNRLFSKHDFFIITDHDSAMRGLGGLDLQAEI